jgi:hypothetical protein
MERGHSSSREPSVLLGTADQNKQPGDATRVATYKTKLHPHVKRDEISRPCFIRDELKHRIDHPVSCNSDDTSCHVQERPAGPK